MERAHALTKQPSTVVLVAQVSGMQDAASLRDGVLALRERGHRPVLISLHEERFLAAEGTMPEVTALLVDHAVRERALGARAIADVGIPVVPAHRASSPAAVWHAAHAQAALRHR